MQYCKSNYISLPVMEVTFFDGSQPSSFLVMQNTDGIKAIASGICLSVISKQNQFHIYIYVNMYKYCCTLSNLNSLKAFPENILDPCNKCCDETKL